MSHTNEPLYGTRPLSIPVEEDDILEFEILDGDEEEEQSVTSTMPQPALSRIFSGPLPRRIEQIQSDDADSKVRGGPRAPFPFISSPLNNNREPDNRELLPPSASRHKRRSKKSRSKEGDSPELVCLPKNGRRYQATPVLKSTSPAGTLEREVSESGVAPSARPSSLTPPQSSSSVTLSVEEFGDRKLVKRQRNSGRRLPSYQNTKGLARNLSGEGDASMIRSPNLSNPIPPEGTSQTEGKSDSEAKRPCPSYRESRSYLQNFSEQLVSPPTSSDRGLPIESDVCKTKKNKNAELLPEMSVYQFLEVENARMERIARSSLLDDKISISQKARPLDCEPHGVFTPSASFREANLEQKPQAWPVMSVSQFLNIENARRATVPESPSAVALAASSQKHAPSKDSCFSQSPVLQTALLQSLHSATSKPHKKPEAMPMMSVSHFMQIENARRAAESEPSSTTPLVERHEQQAPSKDSSFSQSPVPQTTPIQSLDSAISELNKKPQSMPMMSVSQFMQTENARRAAESEPVSTIPLVERHGQQAPAFPKSAFHQNVPSQRSHRGSKSKKKPQPLSMMSVSQFMQIENARRAAVSEQSSADLLAERHEQHPPLRPPIVERSASDEAVPLAPLPTLISSQPGEASPRKQPQACKVMSVSQFMQIENARRSAASQPSAATTVAKEHKQDSPLIPTTFPSSASERTSNAANLRSSTFTTLVPVTTNLPTAVPTKDEAHRFDFLLSDSSTWPEETLGVNNPFKGIIKANNASTHDQKNRPRKKVNRVSFADDLSPRLSVRPKAELDLKGKRKVSELLEETPAQQDSIDYFQQIDSIRSREPRAQSSDMLDGAFDPRVEPFECESVEFLCKTGALKRDKGKGRAVEEGLLHAESSSENAPNSKKYRQEPAISSLVSCESGYHPEQGTSRDRYSPLQSPTASYCPEPSILELAPQTTDDQAPTLAPREIIPGGFREASKNFRFDFFVRKIKKCWNRATDVFETNFLPLNSDNEFQVITAMDQAVFLEPPASEGSDFGPTTIARADTELRLNPPMPAPFHSLDRIQITLPQFAEPLTAPPPWWKATRFYHPFVWFYN